MRPRATTAAAGRSAPAPVRRVPVSAHRAVLPARAAGKAPAHCPARALVTRARSGGRCSVSSRCGAVSTATARKRLAGSRARRWGRHGVVRGPQTRESRPCLSAASWSSAGEPAERGPEGPCPGSGDLRRLSGDRAREEELSVHVCPGAEDDTESREEYVNSFSSDQIPLFSAGGTRAWTMKLKGALFIHSVWTLCVQCSCPVTW